MQMSVSKAIPFQNYDVNMSFENKAWLTGFALHLFSKVIYSKLLWRTLHVATFAQP